MLHWSQDRRRAAWTDDLCSSNRGVTQTSNDVFFKIQNNDFWLRLNCHFRINSILTFKANNIINMKLLLFEQNDADNMWKRFSKKINWTVYLLVLLRASKYLLKWAIYQWNLVQISLNRQTNIKTTTTAKNKTNKQKQKQANKTNKQNKACKDNRSTRRLAETTS